MRFIGGRIMNALYHQSFIDSHFRLLLFLWMSIDDDSMSLGYVERMRFLFYGYRLHFYNLEYVRMYYKKSFLRIYYLKNCAAESLDGHFLGRFDYDSAYHEMDFERIFSSLKFIITKILLGRSMIYVQVLVAIVAVNFLCAGSHLNENLDPLLSMDKVKDDYT